MLLSPIVTEGRTGEFILIRKWAQYEYQAPAPNTALAIYQHASSASNLLDASPIRFAIQESQGYTPISQQQPGVFNHEEDEVDVALREERKPGEAGVDEMLSGIGPVQSKRGSTPKKTERSEETQAPGAGDSAPKTPPSATATTQSIREFQITADMSTFDHQAYIERQPYYGGFNVDSNTPVAEDLAGSVPLIGLADISTRKGEVPLRIQIRRAEELARKKTLKEIWEDGLREKPTG